MSLYTHLTGCDSGGCENFSRPLTDMLLLYLFQLSHQVGKRWAACRRGQACGSGAGGQPSSWSMAACSTSRLCSSTANCLRRPSCTTPQTFPPIAPKLIVSSSDSRASTGSTLRNCPAVSLCTSGQQDSQHLQDMHWGWCNRTRQQHSPIY